MLNWKLLGDLSPRELKLECERAGLAASDKDSHNFIRLSKYIMSNGYDPETFFFNTLYQADKTNPLVGMTPSNNPRAEHVASLQAKVTSPTPKPLSASPTSTTSPASKDSSSNPSDESMRTMLELFKTMSKDISKMVSLMEDRKYHDAQCGGPADYESELGSSLPYWDSLDESNVSSSDESSSGSSGFDRRYDRDLLITDNICLAFQHGNCPYGEGFQGFHPIEHGSDVYHYCGLCWTDSPDNQCYAPAYRCPGPLHNS